jgi:1,4-alpha-glucan branching enzyme
MPGYFSLVLHAHLPFVRHPEHERFLEESWLFEAITESYVPLLQLLERWQHDGIRSRLTLTLTPTLCAMLQDPLLQARFTRHLDERLELAEREVHRTLWEKPCHALALFYRDRFLSVRDFYQARRGDLVGAFGKLQDEGQLDIVTCAATHALLPLLASHPPSLRAQILVARDDYRVCFGRDPLGIWLPECAYAEAVEPVLKEANLSWFVTDTHGVLHARPRPGYGVFAPIITPAGLAAFGRDHLSAKQVWSRDEGYPGDPRYRDFYRDVGFDLDLDYLQPYLSASGQRAFTGIKYHRITGGAGPKAVYDRADAVRAADEHAGHFLSARRSQFQRLAAVLPCPPVVLSPYDAELFGHWWYEGPEFLDFFVRKAFYDQKDFALVTPEDYLRRHPTHQAAAPAASSWGEGGYWRVWLNERNHWIYPHLLAAQERMTELARSYVPPPSAPTLPAPLRDRALKQAARELLLAQASDWSFILRTGTSPEYAADRVKSHLARFNRLYEQLRSSAIDGPWLASLESADNLFPDVDYRYWA